MTLAVLTQNDEKRSFHKKRRSRSIFRLTVMTKALLTQNDAKRI